jgi:hypothetical protein
MRLWSLHPSYLDAKGLVALWREGLLARKVLRGETRGYRQHAQLIRFKAHPEPLSAIECYLWGVFEESARRGYHFDGNKLESKPSCLLMTVTSGQLRYELAHLLGKLKRRATAQFMKVSAAEEIQAHPLFQVVPGEIERWERGEKHISDPMFP